jgi:tRNA (guanine37-N1)-methyltransferase
MRFTVITILPELIHPAFAAGVVGRAAESGLIVVDTINPRDFTTDKHRTVDDTPYGGGPGMVMKVEPLLAAIAKASAPLPPPPPPAPESAASIGRRLLKSVEAKLTRLATPSRPNDGADSGASAASAADQAEAAIAEIEAQLRGEGTGTTTPHAAPGSPASAKAAPPPAPIAKRVTKTEEELGAEATLAELELELGLRAAPADLAVGSRRSDAKILGPAEEEEEANRGPTPISAHEANRGPTPISAHEVQHAAANRGPTPINAHDVQVAANRGPTPINAHEVQVAANRGPTPISAHEVQPGPPASSTAGSRPHRILMSPSGKTLTQARVRELAALDHVVLVCGRYEGIDQRVIDTAIDEEISIGDYVLSGGELAALVVIDAVARYVPGVLGEATSTDDESFSAGLLEYPQYTRPQVLEAQNVPAAVKALRPATDGGTPAAVVDQPVPAILQSGNHAAIATWRRKQSIERTAKRRPDLFRAMRMTKADRKLYAPLRERTHLALCHHPVVDRNGTIVTTAVTNFDIHDLARSSMTYGLAGYHIITPVTSQREKAANIATLWIGDEKGEHRAQALRLVRTADSIETVIAELTVDHARSVTGRAPDASGAELGASPYAPLVVATSAKPTSFPGVPRRTAGELVAEASLDPRPMLILLGTGWGLAESLIPSVSRVLAPIEGDSEWNHLSVRSAAAIILDRLFGRPA